MSAASASTALQAAGIDPNTFSGVPGGDARLAEIRAELNSLLDRKAPLTGVIWSEPEMSELERVCDELLPIDDRLEELLQETVELAAATPEGKRTKAMVLMHVLGSMHVIAGRFEPDDTTVSATLSLCSDILSRGSL